ncbi:3' terminal RNA ribose 2'-O-methyltransferase Hen1 [Amycolatopsis eburnea]|uniref:Small RNA 2'-O-methyltransferase n=1 Tax=Amycolatopsis eburnea TaxID=2267691 RepID=A0A427T2Y8_9PSEU|nr:3' terminal RNA ribose 2'-O-methyltransferase Hen1 [Amycolatopsis eburnea]RSD13328.1 3' terminal RNA ribose 2'-O-methyltransferase Hen1 [Amycolatopsis eburnea]
MLLTITTTRNPATDLGFLLHKHPEKAQSVALSAGTAHVFYPEAGAERCTAALFVEIDPVGLVRGGGTALTQYVNDRPYAGGSYLAVALRAAYTTALAGRCTARPELVDELFDLEVRVPSLSARGGAEAVHKLFEPLGWRVSATPIPLDPQFPQWGESRYVDLTLSGTHRVCDALRHLYVLLPALDGDKHYWVGQDEADKLLRAGEGWLAGHPERELIANRYLDRRRPVVNYALSRLAESDDVPAEAEARVTELPDQPESLASQRHGSVLAALRAAGARRVLDLGCGSGALLRVLEKERSFVDIVGVDVSAGALAIAEKRLGGYTRVTLRQSALTYADPALAGYDAAVLMEVVEHVDADRLPALEHAVFGVAAPRTVIVTTPNAEYNRLFEFLPMGHFRHADHRFEWTRAEFRAWADGVATRRGYEVRYLPIGPVDQESGPPTQMAVFSTSEEVAA